MDFDGAIVSLLSAATSLAAGGDHVAARGAEAHLRASMYIIELIDDHVKALAMQVRGDRDASKVAVARAKRDYMSCKVLTSANY